MRAGWWVVLLALGCGGPASRNGAETPAEEACDEPPTCAQLAQRTCFEQRLARVPAHAEVSVFRDVLGLTGNPSGGVESGEAVETYSGDDCQVALIYGVAEHVAVEVSTRDAGNWRLQHRATCGAECITSR